MAYLGQLITKHPEKSQRLLEILPGFISWNLILLPFWGSFLFPAGVAIFVLVMNIYWLYKSSIMAWKAWESHKTIKEWEAKDFSFEEKNLTHWDEVRHLVVIPTYKEPGHILVRTLQSLADQVYNPKHIIPVIAFEARAGEAINEPRRQVLVEQFGEVFAQLIFSYHPADLPGEVIGKSSNMAWAAKIIHEEVEKHSDWNPEMMTISSADSDVVFHRNHFAALTREFLINPNRHLRLWQGAMMFYNNIDKIHWPMRVFNRLCTVASIASLKRQIRLINFSTYSMSWMLMKRIGYWDTDVIPEDYRVFFKTYFETGGQVKVEPIYLPVYADAAESVGFWNTFTNTYEQVKRWAWGTSDDAYIIKRALTDSKANPLDKFIRVGSVVRDHTLWPVNWFILTLGALLPVLLNPEFAASPFGQILPGLSSALLTPCLIGLAVMVLIDVRSQPGFAKLPAWRRMFSPLEFILLPLTTFFFSALPGLDSHTRLMVGKYMEYRVTEKV